MFRTFSGRFGQTEDSRKFKANHMPLWLPLTSGLENHRHSPFPMSLVPSKALASQVAPRYSQTWGVPSVPARHPIEIDWSTVVRARQPTGS